MTTELALIYGDEFLKYDFGGRHPLREIRLKLVVELIQHLGLIDSGKVSLDRPPRANIDDFLLFHSRDYVEFVRAACEAGTGYLDRGDTPAFPGCVEAEQYIVGGSLAAVEMVLSGNVSHAFNIGGGLHHAHPGRASGFCVFNDPAICIAALKKRYGLSRIAYVDIDAHHGDGVMYGFYSDPTLLDVDFHEDGRHLFPGTGWPEELGKGPALNLKVNVPFPPHTGDSALLYAFNELVPSLLRRHRPEIILMQCGSDGHQDDPLSTLEFSHHSYIRIAQIMHDLAHEICGGRLILFGGGGYDLAAVSVCWSAIASTIVGQPVPNSLPEGWRASFERIAREKPPLVLPPAPTAANDLRKVQEIVTKLGKAVLST
ncbi:MAG: acetoin utilization protein AcuC [Chloroflexi bacterium]|nr:acetoin utilization protein AcuC [Chloroflexota bacterium]